METKEKKGRRVKSIRNLLRKKQEPSNGVSSSASDQSTFSISTNSSTTLPTNVTESHQEQPSSLQAPGICVNNPPTTAAPRTQATGRRVRSISMLVNKRKRCPPVRARPTQLQQQQPFPSTRPSNSDSANSVSLALKPPLPPPISRPVIPPLPLNAPSPPPAKRQRRSPPPSRPPGQRTNPSTHRQTSNNALPLAGMPVTNGSVPRLRPAASHVVRPASSPPPTLRICKSTTSHTFQDRQRLDPNLVKQLQTMFSTLSMRVLDIEKTPKDRGPVSESTRRLKTAMELQKGLIEQLWRRTDFQHALSRPK